jgi:hypothetical protein
MAAQKADKTAANWEVQTAEWRATTKAARWAMWRAVKMDMRRAVR